MFANSSYNAFLQSAADKSAVDSQLASILDEDDKNRPNPTDKAAAAVSGMLNSKTTTTPRSGALPVSSSSTSMWQNGYEKQQQQPQPHKVEQQQAASSYFSSPSHKATDDNNKNQHPMSGSSFSSTHNKALGSFASWLGDAMYSQYGLFFKRQGFDNVEVLRSLSDTQIDYFFSEVMPQNIPTGHRFLIMNKMDELKKAGHHHKSTRAGGGGVVDSARARSAGASSRRPLADGGGSGSRGSTMSTRNKMNVSASATATPKRATTPAKPSTTTVKKTITRTTTPPPAQQPQPHRERSPRPQSPHSSHHHAAAGNNSSNVYNYQDISSATTQQQPQQTPHAFTRGAPTKKQQQQQQQHGERPKWVGSKGPSAAQLARHVPGSPSAAIVSPPRPFILNHPQPATAVIHGQQHAAAGSRANSPGVVAPTAAASRSAAALETGRAHRSESFQRQQLAETYTKNGGITTRTFAGKSGTGLTFGAHAVSTNKSSMSAADRSGSANITTSHLTPRSGSRHASRPHAPAQHPPRAIATTRVEFSSRAPLAANIVGGQSHYGGALLESTLIGGGSAASFNDLLANLHHPPPSAGLYVSPPRPPRR